MTPRPSNLALLSLAALTAIATLAGPLRDPPIETEGRQASVPDARLIVPGRRVGPVRLGESLADLRRMLQSTLPRSARPYYALRGPSTSLYGLSECGKEIQQTSWRPPGEPARGFGPGGVTVYLTGGRVNLISSGVELYATKDGLRPGSTPAQVQRLWPDLPAHRDNETSMALNNRPVIYWVSQAKGIAFAFASNGPRMGWTRSLDTIEVFRPSWKFQPHGCAWPGEWSPLPSGTIHLRHATPPTSVARAAPRGRAARPSRVPAPRREAEPYPTVRPLRRTFAVPDVVRADVSLEIHSTAGAPIYRLQCHSAGYVDPNFMYSGDFECRLNTIPPSYTYSTLLTEDAHQSADWESRGRFFAADLRGACADIPQFGARRSFKLRGMDLTLAIRNWKFAKNGKLRSLTLRVTVRPDPDARRPIAAIVPLPKRAPAGCKIRGRFVDYSKLPGNR